MAVLFDIAHAYDLHFFKHTIRELMTQDINVVVSAKNKPHVFDIARYENIPFLPEYHIANNFEKVIRLPERIVRLNKLIKKFKIKLVVGTNLVDGSISAKLCHIPSLSFLGNRNIIGQISLSYLFSTHILTPELSKLRLPSKQILYKGYEVMAYLHPKRFQPKNLDYNIIRKLISKGYPVLISSEGSIPRELEKFQLKINDSRLHHLLAFSRLYIGAGASTALEAAYLGIPVIYTNPLVPDLISYVIENYDIIKHNLSYNDILKELNAMLKKPLNYYKNIGKSLQSSSVDLTKFIVNSIKSLI